MGEKKFQVLSSEFEVTDKRVKWAAEAADSEHAMSAHYAGGDWRRRLFVQGVQLNAPTMSAIGGVTGAFVYSPLQIV